MTVDGTRGLLLTGVGGQGVVLASMIAADAMLRAGYDVKQSEVHGMAQRGGSVVSHIRFGPSVDSPLVPLGTAEVMAAFEWAEALRWLPYVRQGGAVVASTRRVVPPGACTDRSTWATAYPTVENAVLREHDVKAHLLDAASIATNLGNVRAANSVVLGAAAAYFDIDDAHWEAAIGRLVPAGTAEVNLAAFRAGRTTPEEEFEASPQGAPRAPLPPLIEIRDDWCKGCDICSRVCPEHCLAVDSGGTLSVVNPEACTGCRLCEMLCPDFAISIHAGAYAPAARSPGASG